MSSVGKRSILSDRRRVLENPYAFLEQIETDSSEGASLERIASEAEISNGRKVLENPYAYLDGSDGTFGAYSARPRVPEDVRSVRGAVAEPAIRGEAARETGPEQIRIPDHFIQSEVSKLHEQIWRQRFDLWSTPTTMAPVDMLDPAVALGLLGFESIEEEGLGQQRGAHGMIEVAGLIDRKSSRVYVSRQFPISVRTFTLAHELGHAVLHTALQGVHRDRPLDGTSQSRTGIELEADRFATLFLMPAKLVRAMCSQLFGPSPFELTEDTSFALLGVSLTESKQALRVRRDLARRIASTEHYDGKHFDSMAKQFAVSVEAMAIRLEELRLVDL